MSRPGAKLLIYYELPYVNGKYFSRPAISFFQFRANFLIDAKLMRMAAAVNAIPAATEVHNDEC